MEKIISLLRKFSLPTLHEIAGPTIVSAVKSVYSTDLEREISTIVYYKYSTGILNNKKVRNEIIDNFSSNEINHIASELKLKCESQIEKYNKVRKYFGGKYNLEKSKILADFLGIGADFYNYPTIDHRQETENITNQPNEKSPIKPYLHNYQKRVKDAISKRIYGAKGRRLIVQMPTGAGKTYTALEAVVDELRKPDRTGFIVWIVDSNELTEQALESFMLLWKLKGDAPTNVFRLFKDFEPIFSNYKNGVVFSSFDKFYSVISNDNHPSYKSVWHLIKNTTLLIVDEAHMSIAETYEQSIQCFIGAGTANIIGLTATPGRSSSEGTEELTKLYSGELISLTDKVGNKISDPIAYLQNEKYLAKITTETLQGVESPINTNTSNERILSELASDQERNKKILDKILIANDLMEPTLVFACTKDHVYALLVLCRAYKIPAKFITGDVPQNERLEILDSFRNGEFFILINLNILSTGIDVPNVKKLIITRPVGSRIQYSQILGRALRGPRNGGNETNFIVNIKDNISNFPDVSTIYKWFELDWKQPYVGKCD